MGIPRSPETRDKIGRASRLRRHTPETKAKISAALTGRPVSVETRAKISEAHRGLTHTPETRAKLSAMRAGTRMGPDSPSWAGDDVGYHGAHIRVRESLHDKPCVCCGVTDAIDAALRRDAVDLRVDRIGRFSINVADYMPLCRGCHRIYDTTTELGWFDHFNFAHQIAATA